MDMHSIGRRSKVERPAPLFDSLSAGNRLVLILLLPLILFMVFLLQLLVECWAGWLSLYSNMGDIGPLSHRFSRLPARAGTINPIDGWTLNRH